MVTDTTAVMGRDIEQSNSARVSKKPEARPHLGFLDGLRGLAALYVMLFHAYSHVSGCIPLHSQLPLLTCGDPQYAVCVFIVLSGYCLMLPVVRSANESLPGGVVAYIKRRARRILPPYYAAFALALIPLTALQLPKYLHHRPIDHPVTAAQIISHLLLIHNLNSAWTNTIDSPMWSLPTEWQAYFLLPLIFLPVWRRYGNVAVICVGFFVGLAPYYLLHLTKLLNWSAFWFFGLFTLGMAGAAFGFSNRYEGQRKRYAQSSGGLVLGIVFYAAACVVAWVTYDDGVSVWRTWPIHTLIGLATISLIVYLSQPKQSALHALGLRFLQSRPIMTLGAFSYSLYLVHDLILDWGWWIIPHVHALSGETARVVFLVFFLVPLAVAASYSFHLVFERPFQTRPSALKV